MGAATRTTPGLSRRRSLWYDHSAMTESHAPQTCVSESLLTLAAPCSHEEEVKKSRFIARAAPVGDPAEVTTFLREVGDPRASHNCWAYRVGTRYRYSDDGEPSGTAGKPILGAIERQGLDRVMVVVTRFFGGIKLGAGGLVRAYMGVSAECLRRAPKKEIFPAVLILCEVGFEALGTVHGLIRHFRVDVLEEHYTERGVSMTLRTEERTASSFTRAIMNATRGEACLKVTAVP